MITNLIGNARNLVTSFKKKKYERMSLGKRNEKKVKGKGMIVLQFEYEFVIFILK